MVPSADVEIDFDIEWDVDDRVYLWGARVRRAGEGTYRPFVSWELLDESTEKELAGCFVAWLRETVVAANELGESVAVFHYSTPEPTYLKRVLGEAAVADLLLLFVDLLPLLRTNFMGVQGLGIKKVAPAFGFHWRDDDPGGLQSQGWLIEARSGPAESVRPAARQRLLRYNEDDVAATAAIRDGLRSTKDAS
jgi:predicted RecB family nuclease